MPGPEEAPLTAPEPIHLDLLLDDRQAAACSATPEAVLAAAGRLREEFRASSGARGMAMNDAEIDAACWPPLAARLAAMLAPQEGAPDRAGGGFAEAALSFLVTLAFPRPRAGEHFTVRFAASGDVHVERRPRRMMARNSVRLGNHGQAAGGSARPAAASLLCLAMLAALCLSGWPAAAETDGPYVHGAMREGDRKLIVCLDEETALGVARAVNGALMGLRDEILAAPDDAARQKVYEDKLYPSVGWQHLMNAVYDKRCSLVDEADHVSRRTVRLGPPELVAIAASHSVVESEMLYGESQAPLTVWVVTTENVPAVEP